MSVGVVLDIYIVEGSHSDMNDRQQIMRGKSFRRTGVLAPSAGKYKHMPTAVFSRI